MPKKLTGKRVATEMWDAFTKCLGWPYKQKFREELLEQFINSATTEKQQLWVKMIGLTCHISGYSRPFTRKTMRIAQRKAP